MYATQKKPMTENDRVRLGGELAGVSQRLAETKSEKSAVAKVYAGRVGNLENQITEISRQLTDGFLELRIEVEEVPDDARQIVVIVRTDTGEVFDSRPMNEAEKAEAVKRRQVGLFETPNDTEPAPPLRVTAVRPKAKRPPAAAKKAKRA